MPPTKKKWVRAIWIQRVTGWDGEILRQAREQNVIEFRMTERGYEYNICSLADQFIIKKQTA